MDFCLGIFSSFCFRGTGSSSGRLKKVLHLDGCGYGYGSIDYGFGFGERLREGAKIKGLINYKWIFMKWRSTQSIRCVMGFCKRNVI
jgi:hypothetical protein